MISRSVPWLGMESIIRLVKSFDPQNTCLIRYVRISTTLLATLQPAMIELASTFNRVRAKIRITDENREEHECMSELIMVRFLHSLYEECSGGTEWKMVPVSTSTSIPSSSESKEEDSSEKKMNGQKDRYEMKRVPVGMKLEDLPELFSCCVSCVEDEIVMDRGVQTLMQYFYSEAQRTSFLMQGDSIGTSSSGGFGSVSSESVVKYPLLKSSVVLSRIGQEDLIEALRLPQHAAFLKEFIRQVRNFRKLAAPYIFKSAVSLQDSIEQFSSSNVG